MNTQFRLGLPLVTEVGNRIRKGHPRVFQCPCKILFPKQGNRDGNVCYIIIDKFCMVEKFYSLKKKKKKGTASTCSRC